MPRYKLRTLLIVLALGPPMLALGWREWPRYRHARATIVERQTELLTAMAIDNGSNRTAAGVRHAELRLIRSDAVARKESITYRLLNPVAHK